MLEWMHDESVVHDLKTDFTSKTIQDCLDFIQNSKTQEQLHLAIADDNDEYIGTVSLKHITVDSAEFGISIRKIGMGKGFAKYAMTEMINIAFSCLKLKKVYWCVSPCNKRALRFYDKNGYNRCIAPKKTYGYSEEERNTFVWYAVMNNSL